MIPDFEVTSGNLPPGVHWATWEEINVRYGINDTRRKQLRGLKAAMDELKRCGCNTLLLDGSFVTNKPEPGDFDALWLREGVNFSILDPIIRSEMAPRKAQKEKYFGEMLSVSSIQIKYNLGLVRFFQTDRSNNRKGIIAIDLRGIK